MVEQVQDSFMSMTVTHINLFSAHDAVSRHVVAIIQWPGRLIMSCCSSHLTQHL